MFCPECGAEDRQSNQYCRACGVDMRRVRTALAGPGESAAGEATSAREEIGRSIAAKIRECRTRDELAGMVEDVLPEMEKFLETPEEKRMRRMRTGTIVAGAGLGTAIGLAIASLATNEEEMLFLAGLGVVTFFIGLALLLNGFFLTLPRAGNRTHEREHDGPAVLGGAFARTSALNPPPASEVFNSVTESTTRNLDEQHREST